MNCPWLEYRFFTFNRGWVDVGVATLPGHMVSKDHGATYAVSLNHQTHDGPTLVHDLTLNTRSEVFLDQVERGQRWIYSKHFIRESGWQTLRIYMCDPGVIFDHILVSFVGQSSSTCH